MPAATPENWAKARHLWETTPELTITEVAKCLNVAVPTVSIRAKREGWARIEPASLDKLDLSPAVIAEQAIYRLHRLVMESKDENVILKACAMLLDRTMGKVVEPPPRLPGETPEERPQLPGWRADPDRLSYGTDPEDAPASPTAARQSVDPEPPAPTPAAAPPAPPASSGMVEQRTPLRAVPRTPTFWDGPGRVAAGPIRELSRQ